MVDQQIVSDWATLYKRARNGKITVWQIYVDNMGDHPAIVRVAGYNDGKLRRKVTFVKKGTNVGKSNEKSLLDTAIFKAGNAWKAKEEANAVTSISAVDAPPKYIYPMLAVGYNEKKIKFPCAVQPKLNGGRAFSLRTSGDDRIMSRKLKHFSSLTHVKTACDELFGWRYNPDGEIYSHGVALQTQMSRLKKYQEGETEKLEYWVYDLAITGMPFSERHELLQQLIPDDHPTVKRVPTFIVNSFEEIEEHHKQFVLDGYEGLMVRELDSEYEFNARPTCLMKYKKFKNDEFKIVGFKAEVYHDVATDKFWKMVVWICETHDGRFTFSVRPTGSFQGRHIMYLKAADQIGKDLTVKFQEFSLDMVPVFGVGKDITGECIRDYEE